MVNFVQYLLCIIKHFFNYFKIYKVVLFLVNQNEKNMNKLLPLCLSLLLGAFGAYAQCGNQNPDFELGIDGSGQPFWYYSFGNVYATSPNTLDGSANAGHAPMGGAIAINNYMAGFAITPGDEYQLCADMSVSTVGFVWAQIKMEFMAADGTTVLGDCNAGVPGDDLWANYCTSCIAPPGTANINVFAQSNGAEFWVDNLCVTNLAALPIELANITAYAKNTVNVIEWTTKREENVEFFEIQKSSNGANSWRSISRVDAVGFSSTDQFYQLEDKSPSSLNYYRIISRDFDGKSDITPTVVVKREISSEPISLFPNPASTTINLHAAFQHPTNYSINDIYGKIISSGVFLADQDLHQIEIKALTTGVYLFKTKEKVNRFYKQ